MLKERIVPPSSQVLWTRKTEEPQQNSQRAATTEAAAADPASSPPVRAARADDATDIGAPLGGVLLCPCCTSGEDQAEACVLHVTDASAEPLKALVRKALEDVNKPKHHEEHHGHPNEEHRGEEVDVGSPTSSGAAPKGNVQQNDAAHQPTLCSRLLSGFDQCWVGCSTCIARSSSAGRETLVDSTTSREDGIVVVADIEERYERWLLARFDTLFLELSEKKCPACRCTSDPNPTGCAATSCRLTRCRQQYCRLCDEFLGGTTTARDNHAHVRRAHGLKFMFVNSLQEAEMLQVVATAKRFRYLFGVLLGDFVRTLDELSELREFLVVGDGGGRTDEPKTDAYRGQGEPAEQTAIGAASSSSPPGSQRTARTRADAAGGTSTSEADGPRPPPTPAEDTTRFGALARQRDGFLRELGARGGGAGAPAGLNRAREIERRVTITLRDRYRTFAQGLSPAESKDLTGLAEISEDEKKWCGDNLGSVEDLFVGRGKRPMEDVSKRTDDFAGDRHRLLRRRVARRGLLDPWRLFNFYWKYSIYKHPCRWVFGRERVDAFEQYLSDFYDGAERLADVCISGGVSLVQAYPFGTGGLWQFLWGRGGIKSVIVLYNKGYIMSC